MAAGDLVQKGQAWKVGFGDLAYDGYMATDWTFKNKDADDEVVKDTRGATITHILSNPRKIMSGSLLIKDTGSITPPAKGDYVWLQGPADAAPSYYYVDDASVAFSSSVTKLTLSLLLEDSQSEGATFDSTGDQQDTATYDLSSIADIGKLFAMNSATAVVRVVDSDGTLLVEDTDYAFATDTITFDKDEYLATKLTAAGQTATIWIHFDVGAPCQLVVTCTES